MIPFSRSIKNLFDPVPRLSKKKKFFHAILFVPINYLKSRKKQKY